MSDPLVLVDEDRGVFRLTLNRPDKRNALSRELIAELHQAVGAVAARSDRLQAVRPTEAGHDEQARGLVLAAEGPVFCAGMDLREMQDRAASPDAARLWQEDAAAYRSLVEAILRLPLPTVAAVQGPALAGGVGLVLACDLVLAAEDAFFALPEPKRGITAAVVTPLLLYRAHVSAASWLLLSGENVPARQALRFGLCHEVVSADGLDARCNELSRSILDGAPGALALTKRHLLDCAGRFLAEQLAEGMNVSAQARESPEAREGLAAFLKKRPPAWQGDRVTE